MNKKTALVVTSIAAPQKILKSLADGAHKNSWHFINIGDLPSPENFKLEHCDFYSLKDQIKLPFSFAQMCPQRHYSRKNIGYLIAIDQGAQIIVETDDDNMPLESFWSERNIKTSAPLFEDKDWLNAYAYFSNGNIWPRGYPLELLKKELPAMPEHVTEIFAPIQQGLADENPDVDALYRLILPLPVRFKKAKIALGKNTVCPFNSQNTTIFEEVFPLLYLPSFCSFRMTDIWRSFVAQRIFWENNWSLLFHESTVYQERNEHNLLKDFNDEIPGYLNNAKIMEALKKLHIKKGLGELSNNLMICYEALVENKWIGVGEMQLLEAWLSDLNKITQSRR